MPLIPRLLDQLLLALVLVLGVGGAVPGVDCALVGEAVEDTESKSAPAQNLWLPCMSANLTLFFASSGHVWPASVPMLDAECWEERNPYIHTRARHCFSFLIETGGNVWLTALVSVATKSPRRNATKTRGVDRELWWWWWSCWTGLSCLAVYATVAGRDPPFLQSGSWRGRMGDEG